MYRLGIVYDPNDGPSGTFTFWSNGQVFQRVRSLVHYPDRLSTHTFVGRYPAFYGSPMCLRARIYSLEVHNRVLSPIEVVLKTMTVMPSLPVTNFSFVPYPDHFASISSMEIEGAYNTTKPPVHGKNFYTFVGSVDSADVNCQFINFGPQTMNLRSTGFSGSVMLMLLEPAYVNNETVFELSSTSNGSGMRLYRFMNTTRFALECKSGNSSLVTVLSTTSLTLGRYQDITAVYDPLGAGMRSVICSFVCSCVVEPRCEFMSFADCWPFLVAPPDRA